MVGNVRSMYRTRSASYTVCFFIELKVFVNLTYLYLSEINKQGLIFSVGLAHLMISNKIGEKKYYNIHFNQLEYKVSFSENSFIIDAF